LVDRAPAQQHLRPNSQHLDGYNDVAFAALVVLNPGQLCPDNPVPVIADMDSTAAFPLAMKRDAEPSSFRQVIPEELLNLAVGLLVARLQAIEVLASGLR